MSSRFALPFILLLFGTFFASSCQKKGEPSLIQEISAEEDMHPPKIARSTERVFYFQETLDPQAVLEAWKEELFNEEGKRIRSLSFRSDSSLAIKDSLVLVGDSLLELHYDYTRKQEVGVIIDSSLSYQGRFINQRQTNTFESKYLENGRTLEIPIPSISKYEYNSKGQLSQSIQSQRKQNYTCIYSYDAKGNLLEKRCVNKSPSQQAEGLQETETIEYQEKYSYNQKELKILQLEQTTEPSERRVGYKRVYKYDGNDSCVYKSFYKDGKNFLIYKREFDEEGRLITENVFNDSSGDTTALMLQFLYDYNVQGKLRSQIILTAEGRLMQTVLYHYNSEGYVKESHHYAGYYDLDGDFVQTRRTKSLEYDYFPTTK